VIGAFISSAAVALWTVPQRLAEMLQRLTNQLNGVLFPVVVDTDLVLPYDFLLPWRDLCVWVDRRDVGAIGEQVLAFHERLSDADFVELQHECRRLWEEYLSPLGFFRNFHLHLAELEAAVPVQATASATVNDGVPVSASST